MMKVRELKRILEGFDNEAEVKVSNVTVEHETVFSDITDVVYNVADKTVCLVGEGVIVDGVEDTEIPDAPEQEGEENGEEDRNG